MVHIQFEVLGSTGKKYKVEFKKAENTVHAYCNCEAGSKGSYCKHRLEIMGGGHDNIVGGDINDIRLLHEILRDTPLELAYRRLIKAEERHSETRLEVEKARKLLSQAMRR